MAPAPKNVARQYTCAHHDRVLAVTTPTADAVVAAQSRTPTVAALYGARRQGISGEAALREVTSVLPDAYPNNDFRRALKRLAP